MPSKLNFINILFLSLFIFFSACNNHKTIRQKEIVQTPEKMDDQVSDNIKSVLDFANTYNGKINDSVQLAQFKIVNTFY